MHESVEFMLDNPQGPIAPLDEFVEDFDLENEIWWQISLQQKLKLFTKALDEIDYLKEKIEELKTSE